ncbi:hypothetical protein EJ08DRAFT_651324 [Tothia fuscella]|uniref:Vps41 beta-propeller domain-containing protein n=1 Tax=Tothia fuscella TaxID=1048955 RepID=A0A9P4NML2_9PEZI|nr:hypothetical protein EJ08DRAFT_651324 [Tothia fuscella]
MAIGSDDEQDDGVATPTATSTVQALSTPTKTVASSEDSESGDEEDGEDEDEDEDEEPKLKYEKLTARLASVYKSDSTSSFMVAGDKMVIGTHNGNINILTIPSFQTLRAYRAHQASVTSISISPFPPPWPSAGADALSRTSAAAEAPTSSPARSSSIRSGISNSPRAPRQAQPQNQMPATPSNSIYIATSSLDGKVCIQSLVDRKDVLLRDFNRPVQAVALSPEYRSDRTYLSGGLEGKLIRTQGGEKGASSKANTNSAAAAASGWLSSIGIGSSSGSDHVIHSGEGSIGAIKYSLSGNFVAWTTEKGIKILRSDIKLESSDTDHAWQRIAHIDIPNRARWEEMAAVWKARLDWVDDKCLEPDEDEPMENNGTPSSSAVSQNLHNARNGRTPKRKRTEKLVVGWGDSAWIIHVTPESAGRGRDVGERIGASAHVIHHLLFDDCIISGLSLYTPSLLLVLAYRIRDDNNNLIKQTMENTPRRGVHHRQTGLQPELRLINPVTRAEQDVDTLNMKDFASLSAGDYHLSTLYVPAAPIMTKSQRGALGAIGEGLWDVSFGGAARIFSSSASILSGSGSGENIIGSPPPSFTLGGKSATARPLVEPSPAASTSGLKIFLHSPFDCVLAVKRDLSDHLTWLLEHSRYKEAWELVEEHPEVITPPTTEPSNLVESPGSSTPSKKRESLVDFFADESASQTTVSARGTANNSAVEKERRRIGELWLEQLVAAQDWKQASQAAGRVLGTSSRWQHWILTFANAKRFDEITPHIPTRPLKPPIDSMVYEVVLGHYIARDRLQLKQLLEAWDFDMFKISVVTTAIEERLSRGDITENSVDGGGRGRDWRILTEALAKLYMADGRSQDALRCYIRLQDADSAMNLIREHHLLPSISDDLPGFLLLRISKDQLQSAPLNELEEASAEAVHLLVDEAYQGTVQPQVVVNQLRKKDATMQPFLFFYMRSLWKGQGTEAESGNSKKKQQMEAEGRLLVEHHGDLAVSLFAEYDRPLFMEFLRASRSYAFEKASAVCETRHYYPELVYLLSQTGETKRALSLIINRLSDVSLAISFAKEQNDKDLWNDLLDYSMDKPRFIRGLLEEVGTAINPIELVRRIPEGLEIEGLREGIGKMVREYEIQASISEGVAKVLRSEVADGMDALRGGRAKAIKFEVVHKSNTPVVEISVEPVKDEAVRKALPAEEAEEKPPPNEPKPGHCAGCKDIFAEDEKETLIGFACGHVYHLSCLLSSTINPNAAAAAERLQTQLAADSTDDIGFNRSVGAKVAHAHIIRNAVRGGCVLCRSRVSDED